MRASPRITWLLLSLSFLFNTACSDDAVTTSVAKHESISSTTAAGVSSAVATAVMKPTTEVKTTTGALESRAATTPAKPTAAVTTPAVTVVTTSSSASKPVPTKPLTATVTNKPVEVPTSSSGPAGTTAAGMKDTTLPAAVTTSQPKTMTPSKPAGSSGTLVVSLGTSTLSTASKASEPSKTPLVVETTKTPMVSTHGPTITTKQSVTQTTVNYRTSKGAGSTGTEKATVTTAGSHKHTPSKTLEPTGNTGTTSNPSSLTNAGHVAGETSGTKGGTTSIQTTTTSTPSNSPTSTTPTTPTTPTTTAAQPKTFLYSLNNGHEKEEERDLVEVCRRLMVNLQDGNCTLSWQQHNGKIQFDYVEINGKAKTTLANQYYEEITKKSTDNKTLIAILASCGALLIMIVILAVCASHHRKPYIENQQHLTEELHTVENGYHDNPTLEVMEVQPEMQEKKMVLNGEFNDSWIVPIDNLLKEDIPDEEDTHL